MKKKVFFLITALPLAATAQNAADRVLLKNGNTVSGNIYKMEDGNIYLVKTADTVVLRTAAIQSIRFGNPAKDAHPVPPVPPAAAVIPATEQQSAVIRSRTASSFNEMNEQPGVTKTADTEKANVIFSCSMCGGSGNLSVTGVNGKNKTNAVYTFTMVENRYLFSHSLQLQPGEYTWQYYDSRNNTAKGKFVVTTGEEKKIRLFEQE